MISWRNSWPKLIAEMPAHTVTLPWQKIKWISEPLRNCAISRYGKSDALVAKRAILGYPNGQQETPMRPDNADTKRARGKSGFEM